MKDTEHWNTSQKKVEFGKKGKTLCFDVSDSLIFFVNVNKGWFKWLVINLLMRLHEGMFLLNAEISAKRKHKFFLNITLFVYVFIWKMSFKLPKTLHT